LTTQLSLPDEELKMNTATATAVKKPEPVIETVKMEDERVVDFAGKRKLLKESFVNAEGQAQVRLDYRNGASRLFTIPPGMLNKFACHGAEQKLGDEIAGLEDVEDCVMAVDELIDRLYSGEWAIKKEGNGMAGTSVLVKALVELLGKPVDAIKAQLKTKTQAEKIALRNNTKVKPIVERLEAEKAAKGTKVDTDAMLGELAAAA
jgi:hypothetical protein